MILKNKKITVVGLGRSGFAAAKFLAERNAVVRATDGSEKKEVLENAGFLRNLGVVVETGQHTAPFIAESQLIVTSPGVSKKSFPLALARRRKIPVISEVELASHFCKGLTVAVTGSNGKTTTCNLIHRILSAAGKKSVLCGNVGYSFLGAIGEIGQKTIVTLELSSFQLEDSPSFRPKIAVVLNISPNHLDRHKTLPNYIRAKENIFKNQKRNDFLVLNGDDPAVRRMGARASSRVVAFSKRPIAQGVYADGDKIIVQHGACQPMTLDRRRILLPGSHNLENILAAVAVAVLLKVSKEKIQSTLDSFKTLEHRIEPVGSLRGVEFFNDSKSTTVKSTQAAILAMSKPVVLVAGGRDKGVRFDTVERLLREKVKTVILYGEAREKIAQSWKSYRQWKAEANFAEAVRLAFRSASPGDALLLSPMCTSFDQFNSFEERGEAFKRIYKELKKNWLAGERVSGYAG